MTDAAPPTRTQRWAAHVAAVAALLALTLVVFAGARSHALLDWDDQLHLTQNPYLQPGLTDRYAHFWREPYAKLYVPITYNVWAWLYAQCFEADGAFSPRLLHEANIVAHAIAVMLAYVLLFRLVRGRINSPVMAVGLGAAVFAVHPLQVEPVAWISELRGLLAANFALVAMIAYFWVPRMSAGVRAEEDEAQLGTDERINPQHLIAVAVSALLFVGATLCKPSVAAIPLMLFLTDVAWFARPWRRAVVSVLPHVAIALATLVLMRQLQQGGPTAEASSVRRPLVAGDALAFYLGKLVWPFDLSADYSRTPMLAARQTWFWFAWIVPAGLIALLISWRSRAAVTAAGLFLAALLPVSGIVPFEFQRISTVADRYAYLALLGPAFAVAVWVGRSEGRRRLFAAGCTMSVIGMLSWRSIDQLQSWQDSRSIWQHALATNPNAIVAMSNLADDARKRSDVAEATRLYERINRLAPADEHGLFGLAAIAADAGDFDKALSLYARAAELNADEPHIVATASNSVAWMFVKQGRREEAERKYREVISRWPDDAQAHNDLGALLLEHGDATGALPEFEAALRLAPQHALAMLNRGAALSRLGRADEAEEALKDAAVRLPRDPEPTKRLGRRAMEAREWPVAIAWYRRAVAISPEDVDALNDLGQCQAASGDVEAAIATFERAVALKPEVAILRENLEAARSLRKR